MKTSSQPFSGIYLYHTEVGMYHCVCCDAPLFRYGYKKKKKFNVSPPPTHLCCHYYVQKAISVLYGKCFCS